MTLPESLPAGVWEVDPKNTELCFSVKHMMVSRVKGRFSQFEGSVEVDNSINGQATIKVDSIDTGDKVRDSHLTSNEVFSCSKFPEIHFQMTGFRPSQVGLVVTGDLTVKGITSPIELDVTTIPELDKFDGGLIRILATSKLSRKTFGLTWNALIEMGSAVVSDTVTLELAIELVPKN